MSDPQIQFQGPATTGEQKGGAKKAASTTPQTPQNAAELITHTRATRRAAATPAGEQENAENVETTARRVDPPAVQTTPAGPPPDDEAERMRELAGRAALQAWIMRGGNPSQLATDATTLVTTMKAKKMIPRGSLLF
jgi:hypothetical protein